MLTCSATTNLSATILNSYLGVAITDVCPHGYTAADMNHCAHFVSHVMNVAAGTITCKGMSAARAAARKGACIRVQELFKACDQVGAFTDAPAEQLSRGLFIFVTARASEVSFATRYFANVPKKHVGILFNGTIWHYSNTHDKVVTATPAEFLKHYRSQTNALYFGTFPASACPTSLGAGL